MMNNQQQQQFVNTITTKIKSRISYKEILPLLQLDKNFLNQLFVKS